MVTRRGTVRARRKAGRSDTELVSPIEKQKSPHGCGLFHDGAADQVMKSASYRVKSLASRKAQAVLSTKRTLSFKATW